MAPDWSIGLHAQLACIWEATARKAGNVHRFADFADATYLDFILSAAAIAPVLALGPEQSVGETVLECVRATRQVVRHNTNLGIILLLTPLAAIPPNEGTRPGIKRVLAALTVDDSRHVYEAIRLASPGGLGTASQEDVRAEPTLPLREVMALAAERDLIALQYVNDFAQVIDGGVHILRGLFAETASLEQAIVGTHLQMMADHPDSLIARKCGTAEAVEAARRARDILDRGWPRTDEGRAAFVAFDAWLRGLDHRHNPGTSADMVTACLYVLLRHGELRPDSWTLDKAGGAREGAKE